MARLTALAVLLVLAAPSAQAVSPNPAARLADALDRYRAVAQAGGWPTIPEVGPLVYPGGTDATQVPLLRRRLQAEGALGAAAPTGDTLDPALAAALAATQARLGLAADGILGPNTRVALNVSAAERARRIAQAVERLPALDLPTSGRFVLVNLPEYRVRGFEREAAVPIRANAIAARVAYA